MTAIRVAGSAYTALLEGLNDTALRNVEPSGWHQIKPNEEPDLATWLNEHIVLAYGHFVTRADALQVAREIGDTDTFVELLDALPWAGDDLEAESPNEILNTLAAHDVERCSTFIVDPGQTEMLLDAAA